MDLGHFGCCWAVVLLSFHFVHPVHVITAASYSSQNHSRVATGAQTPWRTKMDRFGSRRLPNSRMVPSHPIRMSTTANPNKIVTKEQPTIRMSQVQHGHTSKPASMEFTASIISYHRLWKDPTNTTTTAHLDRKASDTQPDSSDERKMQTLLLENANVKLRLKAIENENFRLHKELSSNRLVLETFENGEGQQRQHDGLSGTVTATFGFSAAEDSPQGTLSNPTNMDAFWCDVLDDDDSCPIEPMVSFVEAVRDRSTWLVGLLILQSGSGFILAQNEALLANHPFRKFGSL